MKSKICRDCHKRKPLTEYYRGDGYADGHYTRCKACCAEERRRHYIFMNVAIHAILTVPLVFSSKWVPDESERQLNETV